MKKEYNEPTLNTIRINGTQLLALSGGEYGESGDAAESKKFNGGLFDEDEPTNDKWY